MLSSCECCCKLRGVWMSWITFILATPPAEEETRGLTKCKRGSKQTTKVMKLHPRPHFRRIGNSICVKK